MHTWAGRHPAHTTAALLTSSLRSAGIAVTKKPTADTVPSTGFSPALQLRSAPLATITRHTTKESDNLFTETLVKGLGREFAGEESTKVGVQLSREFLVSLGASPRSVTVDDGSWLSYTNRLTAETLVRLLSAMRRRPEHFDAFYRSLAVAGKDGTLKQRMRGTVAAGTVHAETGTLRCASCLVGYTTSANGHTIAFAIIMNGNNLGVRRARATQDQLAIALTRSRLPGSNTQAVTP